MWNKYKTFLWVLEREREVFRKKTIQLVNLIMKLYSNILYNKTFPIYTSHYMYSYHSYWGVNLLVVYLRDWHFVEY